jgi:hypothetical protein
VERSAVCLSLTLMRTIATLPFVISTGAQRSGEICGSALSWECFSSALPGAEYFSQVDQFTGVIAGVIGCYQYFAQ